MLSFNCEIVVTLNGDVPFDSDYNSVNYTWSRTRSVWIQLEDAMLDDLLAVYRVRFILLTGLRCFSGSWARTHRFEASLDFLSILGKSPNSVTSIDAVKTFALEMFALIVHPACRLDTNFSANTEPIQ